MEKVLILGGSHRDIPLIKAAQELGFYVITLGNRDSYLGHRYSDKFFKIDFNDLTRVKELIKNENINHILPGCGEESYINTVSLSHELKIGNYDFLETAKLIHNKWKFKKFCLENDICTPKGLFYNKELIFDSLNFPIVVKPTNLSGGRGVEVVYNKSELEIALEKTISVSDEIFLEEFIEGELIAFSIFLENQRIIYSFSGADVTYKNKYLITTAYPIELQKEVQNRLENDIEKLASLLKIVDGMFHFQVLIKDNKPYIIDVTRRIPGDLYPYLIELNDKVEYSKAVVKSYLGEKLHSEFKVDEKPLDFVIRHCVMPCKNGKFKGLFIDDSIKDSVLYKLDLIEEKTIVDNYLQTQIAIVLIKTSKEIAENINDLIYAKMENIDD